MGNLYTNDSASQGYSVQGENPLKKRHANHDLFDIKELRFGSPAWGVGMGNRNYATAITAN